MAIDDGAADPLDREVIESLEALGNPTLIADLVEIFVGEIEPRLARLRTAAAGSDTSTVADVAHSLKGSSGNLGLWVVSQLCAELETDARNGVLVDGARLDQLEHELDRGHRRLQELLASGS